jgi:hypothetical protein
MAAGEGMWREEGRERSGERRELMTSIHMFTICLSKLASRKDWLDRGDTRDCPASSPFWKLDAFGREPVNQRCRNGARSDLAKLHHRRMAGFNVVYGVLLERLLSMQGC